MKTSNKVMAQDMSYARRPLSLRTLFAIGVLAAFVVVGGVFVVVNLTATTTPKPGRIIVDIKTLQRIPTAAPIQ